MRLAFWAILVSGVALGAVSAARFLRAPTPDHVVLVPLDRLPAPGGPPYFDPSGHFYLIQLAPGERLASNFDGGPPSPPITGGFLALSTRGYVAPCHFRSGFDYVAGWHLWQDGRVFSDPCGHSGFDRAGRRVSGPAYKPLDTMALSFDINGGLLVDTRAITRGDAGNPLRALLPR